MQTNTHLNDPGYADFPDALQATDPMGMPCNSPAQARVISFVAPGRAQRAWHKPMPHHAGRNTVVPLPRAIGKHPASDFDRDVYCLLGIPIDAADMSDVLQHVREAAQRKQRCFLSTPNLNFLMGCQRDALFRDSLINSDLNIVDGLPLAWMARRLGIPVQRRVTGSGMFEALMACVADSTRQLSVYFFGGREGTAETAGRNLNAGDFGLRCVGAEYPGFGSVEELSDAATIARINASQADFLVVSLGARKGQAWIEYNRHRLSIPVISHLGAVVNFVAGTVSRAPAWVQRFGMEWLWRIKEEPALWSRYWHDGVGMLHLMAMRLLPHLLYRGFRRATLKRAPDQAELNLIKNAAGAYRIALSGAVADAVDWRMRIVLRDAALLQMDLVVDLSDARDIGPAMFGLLLILRKHQAAAAKSLTFTGLSRHMRRLFRWNGVEYLLTDAAPAQIFDAHSLTTAEATCL